MILDSAQLIRSILKQFDIGITRYSTLKKLQEQNRNFTHDLEMLLKLPSETASQLQRYFRKSKSQLRQDLFVLSALRFKTNGFFVEFGAANGIDQSNTYLMEREFGWVGILAEPAKCWHNDLKNNRSCSIETNCVWKSSGGQLTFIESDAAEFSTIASHSDLDLNKEFRNNGKTYDVETISLNDLLNKYNAPREIDYLSIDTEGSEFEILSHFDFSKHIISVITCEHNYTPARENIYELLTKQGYLRVFHELSMFDDWYVNSPDLKNRLQGPSVVN